MLNTLDLSERRLNIHWNTQQVLYFQGKFKRASEIKEEDDTFTGFRLMLADA